MIGYFKSSNIRSVLIFAIFEVLIFLRKYVHGKCKNVPRYLVEKKQYLRNIVPANIFRRINPWKLQPANTNTFTVLGSCLGKIQKKSKMLVLLCLIYKVKLCLKKNPWSRYFSKYYQTGHSYNNLLVNLFWMWIVIN